jgi:hypothetical protein
MSENVHPIHFLKKDVVLKKINQIKKNKELIKKMNERKFMRSENNIFLTKEEIDCGKEQVKQIIKSQNKNTNEIKMIRPENKKNNDYVQELKHSSNTCLDENINKLSKPFNESNENKFELNEYKLLNENKFESNEFKMNKIQQINFTTNLNDNKLNKQISLINFDDDTMRTIIKLDDEKMNMIKKWYDILNINIEIEDVDLYIPLEMNEEDLKNILYQDINYSMKDEYILSYLPLIFEQLKLSKQIKKYEEKFKNSKIFKQFKSDGCRDDNQNNDNNKNKYGIIIPLKIVDDVDVSNVPSSRITSSYIPPNYDNKNNNKNKFKMVKHVFKKNKKERDENYVINDYIDGVTNLLYKSYFSNAKFLDDVDDNLNIDNNLNIDDNLNINDNLNKNNKNYVSYVLYNLKFNKSLVINDPSSNEVSFLKSVDFEKYGFVNLTNIETDNEDIYNCINNNFNNVEFNSIVELNEKLQLLSNNIDFILKNMKINMQYADEEKKVKNYIKYNYIVDNNVNNRMKASTLSDIFIDNKICIDDQSFKVRLAKYLKEIGLEKKRYSDGIYYYGIRYKYSNELIKKEEIKIDANKKIKICDIRSEVFFKEIEKEEIEKETSVNSSSNKCLPHVSLSDRCNNVYYAF